MSSVSANDSGHDIAATISRAFFHDPLFAYFFPNAQNREYRARLTFRFLVDHCRARQGVIHTVGAPLAGASVWLPSTQLHRSNADLIRFGALKMLFQQGPAAIWRQLQAGEQMQQIHPRLMAQPHLYLLLLGGEPTEQGKGLSRNLLQPMLDRLDRENMPCYLDTHNPNNISLYQRFGFQVAHEGLLPDTQVYHWAMVRSPVRS